MKVASNKISDLRKFYLSELKEVYESSEIEALFGFALEEILEIKPSEINLRQNENVNQSDLLLIYDCCKELKNCKPIQYILEKAYFLDLELKVNGSVLIPRPETEELVAEVFKLKTSPNSVLDIGTGSGCISIALKKKYSLASVFAIDKSLEALTIAIQNSKMNQTEINFVNLDFLNFKNNSELLNSKFDLIISNPPYILFSEAKEMQSHVKDYEPHAALFVEGHDEIIFYTHIIRFCSHNLQNAGHLFLELNPITSHLVYTFAVESKLFSAVEIINDMSGKQRILKAKKI